MSAATTLKPKKKGMANLTRLLRLAAFTVGVVMYQQYNLLVYTAHSSPVDVGFLNALHQQGQQLTAARQPMTVNLTEGAPTMYHCGVDGFGGFPEYSYLLTSIFPEYKWVNIETQIEKQIVRHMQIFRRRKRPLIHYRTPTQPYDIFLNHWDNICSNIAFRFVWQFFEGKTIFVYPEAHNVTRPIIRDNFIELGPMESHRNHILLTYMQVCFWMNLSKDEKNRFFYKRPRGSARHFLIYAHSNCIKFREDAFFALSYIAPTHYGGVCDGSKGTKYYQFPPNATHANNTVKLHNFHENAIFFSAYKFCLVLEHAMMPGYITEKILNAFLAGCVPIYHGPEEIFLFFNKNAFVYYDPDSPQEALDLIANLNKDDQLYDAMLSEPILANGEQTIQDHFSFGEDVGEGRLKERMRKLVGLDSVTFVS
jgi:hypothetical protein